MSRIQKNAMKRLAPAPRSRWGIQIKRLQKDLEYILNPRPRQPPRGPPLPRRHSYKLYIDRYHPRPDLYPRSSYLNIYHLVWVLSKIFPTDIIRSHILPHLRFHLKFEFVKKERIFPARLLVKTDICEIPIRFRMDYPFKPPVFKKFVTENTHPHHRLIKEITNFICIDHSPAFYLVWTIEFYIMAAHLYHNKSPLYISDFIKRVYKAELEEVERSLGGVRIYRRPALWYKNYIYHQRNSLWQELEAYMGEATLQDPPPSESNPESPAP